MGQTILEIIYAFMLPLWVTKVYALSALSALSLHSY